MRLRAKATKGKPKFGAELGVLAMAFVCCGGHALVLGALGGMALGSMLGIGAGLLGALLLAGGLVVMRRRRAGICAVPRRDPVVMGLELTIKGMTSEACARHVAAALNQTGATDVSVDWRGGFAAAESNGVSKADLASALRGTSYRVERIAACQRVDRKVC